MAKKLSITVYPAPLSGEFLTVSDAMNQVLDLIEALERSESVNQSERQIVWRLTEAHTNSPLFTVVAEPFPVRPDLSVTLEANRVINSFQREIRALLQGEKSEFNEPAMAQPMTRVLQRNINGIGQTEVRVDDKEPINLVPRVSRVALRSIEAASLEAEAQKPDWQRTEHGSIEVEIIGLTRWHRRPALDVRERLSERRIMCVLSRELEKQLGLSHQWGEVWEGRFARVSGDLHYNSDGQIQRADIDSFSEIKWSDVTIADLRKINVVGEASMDDALAVIRENGHGQGD